MENLLNIFVKSIFIDNMIFAYFLGMCSYLAVSKTVKTSLGLGIAVVFVLTVTVPINWLLQNYVLSAGSLSWLGEGFANIDLSFLSFIMFIAVIAAMVQITEMVVEKFARALYNSLGVSLPLIGGSCARVGGCWFLQEPAHAALGEATVLGLRSGIGWLRAIVRIAAIREQLQYCCVRAPLRGLAIPFIVTGLLASSFMS